MCEKDYVLYAEERLGERERKRFRAKLIKKIEGMGWGRRNIEE